MGTDARGAPAHLPRYAHPGRATAGSNSRRRRVYALTPLVLAIVGPVAAAAPPAAPARSSGPPPRASFTTGALRVALHGEAARLFTIGRRGQVRVFEIAPPILEVDGVSRTAVLAGLREAGAPRSLGDGVTERRYRGVLADDPALTLEVVFRTTERHSVLRFAYRLFGADGRRLTRRTGADALTYLSASLVGLPLAREVRLSEFVERLHSYTASERPIDVRHFDNSRSVMGPLLLASDRQTSLLLGYEHGSPVPDAFLEFALSPGRGVTLRAVKGNIVGREALSPDRAFETVWLEAGVLLGDNDAVAAAYRQFVHEALMAGNASRKPLVFYNTWNFQERNHWVNDKSHLDSMSEARMLTEIDVARRMGIDVFVLDKGWYEKTGDWAVSAAQFPNGLGPLKARLDAAGMRLGLWFNPLAAAESSRAWEANKPHVRSTGGKTFTGPVWETEDSHQMCLVSPWGEAFAEALVRVARETGATYFKWDGVGQWGCDAPGHGHGGDADTAAARAEAYAFELPRVMMRLARNVAEQIPGAIVDFDVTEGGRAVGLGFLSAGKYVLINNGPNKSDYDGPIDRERGNSNLFFHKGPARTWICRGPLGFDRWIPSVAFLSHFLPDDPEDSQMVNLASLVLGGNGIWGDLPAVSIEGVERIGRFNRLYRQVRDDVAAASPLRSGEVGGAPEIHEKLTPAGRGAVVAFATAPGRYSWVTAGRPVQRFWASEGASVRFDARGRAVIDMDFSRQGAHVVFFGAQESPR